ncbi:hypothetical protein [Corallococcus silvisoli]|uniref:hypothetical protein n=1 Tax=Corallococcus silvisoli TaxID=2697031 RepID=UPI0013765673|nr:hypothetical protein [Corallococcus silvisoli]NBD13682.1 hypothetical protein [Corallococcus silvisoli]
MGARRFFFFLPNAGVRLDFGAAIAVLDEAGLEFDSGTVVAGFDEQGVAVESRRIETTRIDGRVIEQCVKSGLSLEAECRDPSLFMTCVFGSPHPNPIFSMIVSLRVWRGLGVMASDRYEKLLVRVAKDSGAASVLVVDDPSDDFLARLVVVDDQWVMDPCRLSGVELEALSILIAPDQAHFPVMRSLRPTGRCVLGYLEYRETIDGDPSRS